MKPSEETRKQVQAVIEDFDEAISQIDGLDHESLFITIVLETDDYDGVYIRRKGDTITATQGAIYYLVKLPQKIIAQLAQVLRLRAIAAGEDGPDIEPIEVPNDNILIN